MNAQNRTASPATPAGNIYDLGYRHYEGKRHGRWYAIWSLYVESMRGVWGFGRPMTAKAAPFILLGLYAFPSLIQLAFSSLIAQAATQGATSRLFAYDNYFDRVGFFIVLYLVAQAPELVCRDQRYHVLPLYFTRALGRVDYALARLAALATALFICLMLPMVALFVGDVLMKPDTLQAVGDEWPRALPAVPACALAAVSLASISLALSAFSPRRAYSAIGLVAYFLLMEIVPAVVYGVGQQAGWDWADKLVPLRPTTAISSATDWFFGVSLEGLAFPPTLGTDAYVLAVLISIAAFTGILLFRYRRVAA
jgi:ABC-2 type transport system permease protein